MDIVGSLGYGGQTLTYFSHGLLAYVTGKSVCVIDVTVGPRELIWRHESGINKIATNSMAQKFAIVPSVPDAPIEIFSMQTMKVIGTLSNPTGGAIVDAAFSRSGDLLCAISDTLDRNVFVYDVNTQKLLFSSCSNKNFANISFNPIDSNQMFAFGEGGICFANVQDLIDVRLLKVTEMSYDAKSIGSTVSFAEDANLITCSVWLPGNKVVFGSVTGRLFEADLTGNRIRAIGTLANDDHSPAYSYPLSLLLTIDHLIVGTSDGSLFWIPMSVIHSDTDSLSFELVPTAVQISSLRGCITTLVSDPISEKLYVGSDSGAISKFGLQVAQKQRANEDDDPQGEELAEQVEEVTTVVGEKIGTFQEGAVMCVCSVSTPIIGTSTAKIAKKSTHLLSMLVTGSHFGRISFWKQPANESEPIPFNSTVTPLTIRRSAPKPLKLLNSQDLFHLAAPCVISPLPASVRDGTCVLGVGTTSGYLEVFKFDAIETDDDEEDIGENSSPVDEDGMRLSVWGIARYKLFEKSVTCISKASDWDTKGAACLVAVGSYFDPRIFILILDDKDGYDIAMQLNTDIGSLNPTSLCFADRSLHACFQQGYIASFSTKLMLATALEITPSLPILSPETVSYPTKDTSPVYISAININYSSADAGECIALLASTDVVKCLEYLGKSQEPSDDGDSSILSATDLDVPFPMPQYDPFQSLATFGEGVHADVVLCASLSPNGTWLASGNAAGSIFLWQHPKDAPAGTGLKCVATAALHSCPVIALAFACDSSLIISCGADGSVFVLSVDRPAHIEYEFETSRHSVRARKFQHANTPFISIPIGAKLWIDDKKEEETAALRTQYSETVAELTEGAAALTQRLKTLLDRNSNRNDLEKMERGEFAIDLQLRDRILTENSETVAKIRENYQLRDFWNELHAARVRFQCYDSMHNSARSILPFNTENTGDVNYVSAFSIPKVSEREQNYMKKIMRLRAIEMRSQRAQAQSGYGAVQRLPNEGKVRSCWAPNIQGTSSHMTWLWGDGSGWPTAEVSTYILQKEQEAKAVDSAGAAAGKDKEGKDKDGKDKGKDATSAGAVAPSSGTSGAPGAEGVARAADDDDDRSLNSQDAVADVDESDIFNLLYSPQCIRTDAQKRMHILMLKEVVRMIKLRFNEHFDKYAAEKESVMNAVDAKNQRISAILEELHQSEDIFRPVLGDVEKAGSAITVFDSEIENRPFETEAMRQARLREEEEARRREAADDKKEALMRALDDMMHGTLEVKRNVLEEANALVRPDWMNEIAEADMTEAQLKEYDAFNAKLRALQEEQTLYRKQLEQELKKLKAEVLEITKAFDEKLISLCKIKVLTARAVLTHELYISRIGHGILRVEQCIGQLAALDQSIDKAKRERKELQARIERYCVHCEEVRTAYMAADSEYRQMEKQFKTHLLAACGSMAIDSEKLRILQICFNERSYARDETEDVEAMGADPEQSANNENRTSKRGSNSKETSRNSKQRAAGVRRSAQNNNIGSNNLNVSKQAKLKHGASKGLQAQGSRNSGMVAGMGPLQEAAMALQKANNPEDNMLERDPFYLALLRVEKSKKQQESQIPLLKPLSMDDLPEGFVMDNLQFVFSKVQELRLAKLEKEIEAKRLQIKYGDLKTRLDAMHSEELILEGNMRSLRTSKEDLQGVMRSLNQDLEVVLVLKQGQDEVNNDAIVTDYSDAMCMPVSVVQRFNARIKELGRDKISMLTKIKTFRRKINLVDWEAKHLSLECRHYEEYYTDLQLFRVTRELQQILREGSDAEKAKERLEKVSQRKDFMQKDADARLQKLRKTKEQMKRQLAERSEEINSLERRVGELRGEVAERQSVQQSRAALKSAGPAGSAQGSLTQGLSAEALGRMKNIIARRHLVDTARAQAEEIDFLRQELDKIRQKTFPSFIRAVKKRLPNPDERL